MKITVCDAPMGAGKTESAISMMNADTENKYIFLTPYLTEIERIKASCPAKRFMSPEHRGVGKLNTLHELLEQGENIASTHALFSSYTEHTCELIKKKHYKLVLDEVFNVVESLNISKGDIKHLFQNKCVQMNPDGEHVDWIDDSYKGNRFQDVMLKAQSKNLIYYRNSLMFWLFPVSVFEVFDEVLILTYMFDSQIQKYYYDANKLSVDYIGTRLVDGHFEFCKEICNPEKCKSFKDKVHILQHEKMNEIGEDDYSLSVSWFKRDNNKRGKPCIEKLRKNMVNLFNNIYGTPSACNMWTCYKEYKGLLRGKGYTSGFLFCNARATNEFRHKTHLAYLLNVFMNPLIKGYFTDKGARIDEDRYALSEMVQWIWRSAIRDGKDIWVYIPSRRMRNLLQDWLNSFDMEDTQHG